MPPPGRTRWDGSGFAYPADLPDPRRAPGAFPQTRGSAVRTVANVRLRAWYERPEGERHDPPPEHAMPFPFREFTVKSAKFTVGKK